MILAGEPAQQILGVNMKRVLKFFGIIGDALGLVILLGGLMIATNNTRSAPLRKRAKAAPQPAHSLGARRAAA